MADSSDLSNLLDCSICFDALTDAVETECCHSLYCQACLQGWVQSNGSCPACRARLAMTSTHANIPIQRFVNAAPVVCPFSFEGCPAHPARSDLAAHQHSCEFRPAAREAARAVRLEALQAQRNAVEQLQGQLRRTSRPTQRGELRQRLAAELSVLVPQVQEAGQPGIDLASALVSALVGPAA